MKAHDYAPFGPIEKAPTSPTAWQVNRGTLLLDRRSALLDALDGAPLGAYDHRIIDWLCGWDDPTVRTVVSLILRARAAGGHPDQPREDA